MPAKRKSKGVVLGWLRDVLDTAEADTGDRPAMQAIMAVAGYRVIHADPDGKNCRPSARKMAERLELRRNTVVAVDQWLVAHGLMQHVRFAAHRVVNYRLTRPEHQVSGSRSDTTTDAPVVSDELPPTESSGSSTATTTGSSGTASGNASGSSRATQPPTSHVVEEGGKGTSGPPGGAPPSPSDLQREDVQRVLSILAEVADVDPTVLAPTIIRCSDELLWSPTVTAHVAKQKLAGSDGRNPGRFIAEGLRRILDGERTQPLPEWAEFAVDLVRLEKLEDEAYDLIPDNTPDPEWEAESKRLDRHGPGSITEQVITGSNGRKLDVDEFLDVFRPLDHEQRTFLRNRLTSNLEWMGEKVAELRLDAEF